MSQFMAWLPYIIICVLLVISRIPELGLKGWLTGQTVTWRNIFGYKDISEGIQYLYVPGVFFIVVALLTIWLHKMPMPAVKAAWQESFSKMRGPTIALCFAVALVAIFRGSATNSVALDIVGLAGSAGGDIQGAVSALQGIAANLGPSSQAAVVKAISDITALAPDQVSQLPGMLLKLADNLKGSADVLPSMPLALAETVGAVAGNIWPLLSAFVGGLGAFITGSATISDLMFGEFQWGMAITQKLAPAIIEGAQTVGGAMGNMVCIHNIVAACAVVGLSGREGEVLRKTFRPFVLYGIVVGIICWVLISSFSGPIPSR